MGLSFATWNLFFLLLIVLSCAGGSVAREMVEKHWKELTDDNQVNKEDCDIPEGVLKLHSMDSHMKKDGPMHVHAHSSISHMDPSVYVVFLWENLKAGKIMPIYFPNIDSSFTPHLLPKEKANTIPFSLKQLDNLVNLFSISQGSPQAKAMEDTLRLCDENKSLEGEANVCATSLESMLDFTREILGFESQIKVVSTTYLSNSTAHFQNYTVSEFREISINKIVPCHSMSYPYAVFHCHSIISKTRVFKVLLQGENGDKVDAVSVCHMDTSRWRTDHVAFRLLGTKRGASAVCHFFPPDDLVFLA